jgi:hypothetical protein
MGATAYDGQQLGSSRKDTVRADLLLLFLAASRAFPEMQVNRAGCAGNLCVKYICSVVGDDLSGFGPLGSPRETWPVARYLLAFVFNVFHRTYSRF